MSVDCPQTFAVYIYVIGSLKFRIPIEYVQWLAEKLAVSISAIRKVARILLFVKIQNILIKDVLKT